MDKCDLLEQQKLRRIFSNYVDINMDETDPPIGLLYKLTRQQQRKRIVFCFTQIGDISHSHRVYPTAKAAKETLEMNKVVFEKLMSHMALIEESKFQKVVSVANDHLKALRTIKAQQRQSVVKLRSMISDDS